MKIKQKLLEQVKLLYVFIFILTVILILPSHLFPSPYFMYLRFPHYLEMMKPIFRISWPMSFEIYHWALLSLAIIGSFNILGLTFVKFRSAARISSFIGIFLTTFIILFFFFIFISVNVSTAIVYGVYSLFLLIVDLLTLLALNIGKKRQ